MKTTKLTIMVEVDLPDDCTISKHCTARIAMNVEGVVDGTLLAHGYEPEDVRAAVKQEGGS